MIFSKRLRDFFFLLLSVLVMHAPAYAQNSKSNLTATGAISPPSETNPDNGQTVDGGGWNAQIAPHGSSPLLTDPASQVLVKAVSDYFNSITSITGSFVQTTADQKRMKGKFSLLRPGRFRFDYALPSKQVIISDGQYIAIQDHDLNNEDRVELDQTPFRLVLRKEVDLARDARITEIEDRGESLSIGLQDKNPDTPGRIKLTLSKTPTLELKEWITTDAQGQDTRIEIIDLVKGEKLNPSLFAISSLTANPLQQ